jgi:hypothetical protein
MKGANDYNWDLLEHHTEQAAKTIMGYFREADLASYKHFLDSMYHYTRNSGEKLELAARVSETGALKDFYTHLAEDEQNHYKLAEADLREFGEQVDPDNPPKPVQRFDDYWQSLAKGHSAAFLGVLYVSENVAKYADRGILDMFPKLELTKAQTRWLRVHAEADLEHGAEVQRMCAQHMDDHEDLIIDAAARMSEFWIEIMKEGLQVSDTGTA